MANKIFVDTNILLNPSFDFLDYEKVYMSIVTIEELDNQKTREDIGYLARKAIRNIENATNKEVILNSTYDITKFYEHKNDNLIISHAMKVYKNDNEVLFITDDLNVKLKSDSIGLPCERYKFKENKDDFYIGCKTIEFTETELANWYESEVKANVWNLEINEYILFSINGEVVDKYKWTLNGFEKVKYKDIKSKFSDKIKPRNLKQELAFDMLQDDNSHIKCLVGCFGSGKDLMMVNTAISLIERNKYAKLVWVVQNQQVADTKDIGALPGGINDKMMPYTSILADKLGGQFGLDMFIEARQIEIMPLAYIRGRSFDNSIIMISEAENITKQHIQLIISRLGENSMLLINGDFKQTDKQTFKENSGLKALINGLKGNSEFGYVMLDKTERSNLAELANLLD